MAARPRSGVKLADAGVRIVACRLPIKSPWLNPIESKWVHGKRRAVAPDRTLSARETAERACAPSGVPTSRISYSQATSPKDALGRLKVPKADLEHADLSPMPNVDRHIQPEEYDRVKAAMMRPGW